MTQNTTALAKGTGERFEDNVALQKLWIATQTRQWRSLAIVGASETGESNATIHAAQMLANMSWQYSGVPTAVFDLRDVSIRLVEYQIQEIQVQASKGDRVFVALRSPEENPTTVPIARATDAVVLCVALGSTDTKAAQKTLAAIGRVHFLGCIVMKERRSYGNRDGRASSMPPPQSAPEPTMPRPR
jgi:hypothetical protein